MTREDVSAALERRNDIPYFGGYLVQTFGVEESQFKPKGSTTVHAIYTVLQHGDYFTKAYLCLFDDPDAAKIFADNLNAAWKRVSKRERMHVYERRLNDADESL